MGAKLEEGHYRDRFTFENDFRLMIGNAKQYNVAGSYAHTEAIFLETFFEKCESPTLGLCLSLSHTGYQCGTASTRLSRLPTRPLNLLVKSCHLSWSNNCPQNLHSLYEFQHQRRRLLPLLPNSLLPGQSSSSKLAVPKSNPPIKSTKSQLKSRSINQRRFLKHLNSRLTSSRSQTRRRHPMSTMDLMTCFKRLLRLNGKRTKKSVTARW